MKHGTGCRLAAMALVVALAAPAAWAGPRGVVVGESGAFWAAVWGWVGEKWAKDGPLIDPAGQPAAVGGGSGDLPSDGPELDPNGCGFGDCTNDGPDADPYGRL